MKNSETCELQQMFLEGFIHKQQFVQDMLYDIVVLTLQFRSLAGLMVPRGRHWWLL